MDGDRSTLPPCRGVRHNADRRKRQPAIFTRSLCETPIFARETLCPGLLIEPPSRIPRPRGISMSDLIWLALLGGLFALTLAFVRLCDGA